MRLLLVSDTHFTKEPRDAHRFDLFRQLREIIISRKIKRVLILGDVLDKKDLHPGKLLNMVVEGILSLAELCEVIILHGNHDSLDNSTPYLMFLDKLKNIRYINYPLIEENLVYLPHSRTPLKDWQGIDLTDKLVFAHVTVNGALAESMIPLDSEIEPEFFEKSKITYCGDIHKAQELTPKVVYIGSPYDTRFNPKSYEGRALIVDDSFPNDYESVILDFPRRLVFDVSSEADFVSQLEKSMKKIKKAQYKVRLHITGETLATFKATLRAIQSYSAPYLEKEYEMCSLETVHDYKNVISFVEQYVPKTLTFEAYCEKQQISKNLVEMGRFLINEGANG